MCSIFFKTESCSVISFTVKMRAGDEFGQGMPLQAAGIGLGKIKLGRKCCTLKSNCDNAFHFVVLMYVRIM